MVTKTPDAEAGDQVDSQGPSAPPPLGEHESCLEPGQLRVKRYSDGARNAKPLPPKQSNKTSSTTKPRYPAPPAPAEMERIREAIRDTQQPELVEDFLWAKPDENLNHQLYYPPITLDRKRRPDGEMVRCPFCSPNAPKFLRFYILWSEDGYLRVIGHVCGSKHFGDEAFSDMEKAARQAANNLSNENFLLTHLPDLPHLYADIDKLAPVCRRVQNARLQFFRDAPSLCDELARMNRAHDGALVVLRKKEAIADGPAGFRSSLGGQESEYEVISVGRLQGASFLDRRYNPVSELSKIRKKLDGLAGSEGEQFTEDDVLRLVCDGLDVRGKDAAVKSVQSAHRRAARLIERLHEMARFGSEVNVELLNRWGGHELNEFRIAVRRGRLGATLQIDRDGWVKFPTASDLQPPPMGHLGRLVLQGHS